MERRIVEYEKHCIKYKILFVSYKEKNIVSITHNIKKIYTEYSKSNINLIIIAFCDTQKRRFYSVCHTQRGEKNEKKNGNFQYWEILFFLLRI